MDEQALKEAMRWLGRRRWAGKSADERAAHARVMVAARERARRRKKKAGKTK